MITIRLSRTGKKHAPQYRIVVQQKHTDPWSAAIEIVGSYNPRTNPNSIQLKEESIKKWIANGAQPSATVHNILVNAGIIKDGKKKTVTISKKRKTKINAKKSAADEAKAAKIKEVQVAKETEATAKLEESAESPTEKVAPK